MKTNNPKRQPMEAAIMSKDIWHEPTETPTEQKTLLFDSIEFDETEMGVYSGGLFHSYNEFEPITPAGLSRWAYLSDFINCQKELANTKKKFNRAIWWLNEIVENHRFTPISTAEKALKELKEEK